MKRIINIEETPDRLKALLVRIKKDRHLSETFDGTINAGKIDGFYTNLALINGTVIGYIRITGEYDLSSGKAQFRIKPSNLFWIVLVFSLGAFSFLSYLEGILFGLFFIFFALVVACIYWFEGRSFVNEIKRVKSIS